MRSVSGIRYILVVADAAGIWTTLSVERFRKTVGFSVISLSCPFAI